MAVENTTKGVVTPRKQTNKHPKDFLVGDN
jgi:hypothetical protein